MIGRSRRVSGAVGTASDPGTQASRTQSGSPDRHYWRPAPAWVDHVPGFSKLRIRIPAQKLVFLGSQAEQRTPQSHQGHMVGWEEGFLGKAKINRLGGKIHGEGVASRARKLVGQTTLKDPVNIAFFHQRHTVGGAGIKHQAALFRTQEARLRLGMFAPRPDAA